MTNKFINKNKGFNLIEIVIIILVTGISSALATGIIVGNSYKTDNGTSYSELINDDNLKMFLNSYSSILSDYYENVNKDELITSAIDGMMSYLGDNYSVYMDENATSDLANELAGEYVGIGIAMQVDEETKEITIAKVYDETPAEEVGFKVGDIIININGDSVENSSIDDISKLIKDDSQNVCIGVLRDGKELELNVTARKILKPVVDYYMIDDKIGYIYLDVFNSSAYVQVKKAIDNLEKSGMESLIFDLRDNTGGFLEEAVDIASMFIGKGKILYSLEDKNGRDTKYDETDEMKNYFVVVLINSGSASAAEILAGALKDSYGAVLVGETSFGKGKVQQTKKVDGNSMIKFTSAKWLRPNGECVDGIGITPDYEVKALDGELPILENGQNSEEAIEAYYQALSNVYKRQLDKAIELLK